MNARQKAKKYKKLVERYKDKAEAYRNTFRRGYGTLETVKIVKYLDDRYPEDEERVKSEMARDMAETLIRDGYIEFMVDDHYNEYNMMRRVVGILKVTKRGMNDEC